MQDFEYAPPVKEVDIVDNLTTDDATKVLSAKQGKVLNDSVTMLNGNLTIINTRYINDNNSWINNGNANNYTSSGIYPVGNGWSNIPSWASWGILEVNAPRTDTVNQTITSTGPKKAFREYRSGAWTNWQELALTSNYEGNVLPSNSNLLDAPVGVWSYLSATGLSNTPCGNGLVRVYKAPSSGWTFMFVNDPTNATVTYLNIRTTGGWTGWKKYTGTAV